MKITDTKTIRICGKCGCEYHEPPATSRYDSELKLCPDCGTREALESIGVSETEQNEILKTIHRYKRNINE